MVPLLVDKRLYDYAVLAIQEPWKNARNSSAYNPSLSRFHLAGSVQGEMRVCFYVNKRFSLDRWDVTYTTDNICTLRIYTGG